MTNREISIRSFTDQDQDRVRRLILEGLSEYFTVFDPALNTDLNDVSACYLQQGSLFIVAEMENDLVGTGALITETVDIARIVRVSVATAFRRRGIGRLIVKELIAAAKLRNFSRIVVETNDNWHRAISLYKSCGFTEYDRLGGEVHMSRQL